MSRFQTDDWDEFGPAAPSTPQDRHSIMFGLFEMSLFKNYVGMMESGPFREPVAHFRSVPSFFRYARDECSRGRESGANVDTTTPHESSDSSGCHACCKIECKYNVALHALLLTDRGRFQCHGGMPLYCTEPDSRTAIGTVAYRSRLGRLVSRILPCLEVVVCQETLADT